MALFRPDVAALLVEALRSGEYSQTSGALHDRRGYCCLGVLCEVARKKGVPVHKGGFSKRGEVAYDGQVSLPPVAVWTWATEATTEPTYEVTYERDGVQHTTDLPFLNDIKKMSFKQIADVIEYDQQHGREKS